MLEFNEEMAKTFLAKSKKIVSDTLTLTRRVSHELAPAAMNGHGLMVELHALVENLNAINGIKYLLYCNGKIKSLDQIVSVN